MSDALVQVASMYCFEQELQLLANRSTLELVRSLCSLELVYC